jgi:hypothetical protein
VTSATSVSVSFVPPASTGGSPITGYEATATPTSSAPAKRKSSATITVKGDKSPIDITGLTTGQGYIFSVVAINAAGGSTPTVTVTPVTPCTLNTATASTPQQEIKTNTNYAGLDAITIATTTGATGIGTATGFPLGITATWSNNSIKISGTFTAANTFDYIIPLTGGCGSVNATGTIVVSATPPPSSCEFTFLNNPAIILGQPVAIKIGDTPQGVESIFEVSDLPKGTNLIVERTTGELYIIGETNDPPKVYKFSFYWLGGPCDGYKATGEIEVVQQ